MLHTTIYKDIVNSYQEKIFAGLSIRRLISCAIAFPLGIAIAALLSICWQASTDVISVVVVIVTIPIFYLGFIRVKGLDPEVYAELMFRSQFCAQRLHFRPLSGELCEEMLSARTERTVNGAEESPEKKKQGKPAALDLPEWLDAPKSRRERKLYRALWRERQAIDRAQAGILLHGPVQGAAPGIGSEAQV